MILNRLQVGRYFKFWDENYLAKGSRPVNPETAFFGPPKSTPRNSSFSFLDENKRIAYKDCYAVFIQENDFESGGLRQESNARPNRLFTADEHIILYRIGNLKKPKIEQIIYTITEIIKC